MLACAATRVCDAEGTRAAGYDSRCFAIHHARISRRRGGTETCGARAPRHRTGHSTRRARMLCVRAAGDMNHGDAMMARGRIHCVSAHQLGAAPAHVSHRQPARLARPPTPPRLNFSHHLCGPTHRTRARAHTHSLTTTPHACASLSPHRCLPGFDDGGHTCPGPPTQPRSRQWRKRPTKCVAGSTISSAAAPSSTAGWSGPRSGSARTAQTVRRASATARSSRATLQTLRSMQTDVIEIAVSSWVV